MTLATSIIKSKKGHGKPPIYPLNDIEKNHFSPLIIGKAYCHFCNQKDIKVINEDGVKGHPDNNYFADHYKNGDKDLCLGSGKRIHQI